MSILTQLGVNQTFWIQLAYFFIAYFFISNFLIKPYRANLEYRKKNTGGSLNQAASINIDTEKLVIQYQEKAKSQNETAQSVYEKLKNEGQQEEDRLIVAARKQGGEIVEQTKKRVLSELTSAREALKAQIPQLCELIASRVLGRKL